MKQEQNEKALLFGLAKKDRKCIEAIYKDNYNLIQALIVNNNGTVEDAKDIFQEAIMVLYEKVQLEDFELNCQIRTYLYSVSRRLWLKRLAQQNKFSIGDEQHFELAMIDEDSDEHEKRNVDFLMMEKAINSLGEPCRSLIEAFYLEKKSMQEIALNFGYTNADNAKTQKYKCLVRLKKLFFAQYKNESL
ncbi:MAG: RNA polymerase subunit sigma-70 [Chitinophagaceae bacterium]